MGEIARVQQRKLTLPYIAAVSFGDFTPNWTEPLNFRHDTAIRALKQGAENFITKPFDADSLILLISKTLEQSRTRRDRLLIGLAQERLASEYFLGSCQSIVRIHNQIERLALSDTTVMLQGETGTGKGVMARFGGCSG